MRFSEKSFEVRFCAAFSSALMPFNRNPQWFGLTQAQERKAGIDTMLKTGGRLLIFQFKAQNKDGRFLLEADQWRNLSNFSKSHKNSTYYVFPEVGATSAAAATTCILKKSWWCSADKLGPFFSGTAKTKTITLDASNSKLKASRPKSSIAAKRTCHEFGCFCPPFWQHICIERDHSGKLLYLHSPQHHSEISSSQPFPPFGENFPGIPIGQTSSDGYDDSRPIQSVEELEELLGEEANSNLRPGLAGLFIPQEQP